MANEFVAKNGLISQNNTIVTGSLTTTGLQVAKAGTSGFAHRTTDYIAGTTGTSLFTSLGTATGNTYGIISVRTSGGSSAAADLILNSNGSGRVAIGTSKTSANATLDVFGNAIITGSLTVSTTSDIPLRIKGGTGTLLSVSSSTSEIFKISDTFSPNLFTVSTGSIDVFNIDNTNSVRISGSLTVTELTANRALTTDGNDLLVSSTTTATELGYLSGATSSIQPQLYSKPIDVPKAWQTMGSTIKAQNLGYQAIPNITVSTALTNQQLRLQAVYLPQSQSIAGVKWWQTVNQSGHTPSNYNGVGLYTVSNGTLSLAASSSNSSTVWTQGANKINSASFATSYPASEGMYFVGLLYSVATAGTAPTFGFTANVVSTLLLTMDFTNSEKINSLLGSQTTLPSPLAMSTTTGAQAAMWVGLF